MTIAQTIDPVTYNTKPTPTPEQEDHIIAQALDILSRRVLTGPVISRPQDMKAYLTLRHADRAREQFDLVYLDSQHRVILCETLFVGTLNQTSVYPREVVKRSLELNAAAVVLSHNHPSGNPQPSGADEILTQTLKSALALVDIRVLDHIITGGGSATSMAEMGRV